MIGLQPDPRGRPHRSSGEPPLVGARHLDPSGDAGPGQLGGRLILVATVGDQHCLVWLDDQEPGAPGESGEVPDVGQMCDQQSFDLCCVEGAPQAVEAPLDIHGLERGEVHQLPFRSAATASIASR